MDGQSKHSGISDYAEAADVLHGDIGHDLSEIDALFVSIGNVLAEVDQRRQGRHTELVHLGQVVDVGRQLIHQTEMHLRLAADLSGTLLRVVEEELAEHTTRPEFALTLRRLSKATLDAAAHYRRFHKTDDASREPELF